MPKLRETPDIDIDVLETHKLIANLPEANSGQGKIVQIALSKVKALLFGLGVKIGGTDSGDILTTDGEQPMSGKSIAQCEIDEATTVIIDGSSAPLGAAISAKANAADLNTKEDKIAATNRPYQAMVAKKSGGTGVITIAPAEIPLVPAGPLTTGYGISAAGILIQVFKKGTGSDELVTDAAVKVSYDADSVLTGIEISSLENTTDYNMSISARLTVLA